MSWIAGVLVGSGPGSSATTHGFPLPTPSSSSIDGHLPSSAPFSTIFSTRPAASSSNAAARDREELSRDMAELQMQMSAVAAKAEERVAQAKETARSLLSSTGLGGSLMKSWWMGGGGPSG